MHETVLQPGERLGFFHQQTDIERVIVYVGGAVLHDLDVEALLELRKSASDYRGVVTWNIQADGIRPLGRGEVDGTVSVPVK